MKICLLYFYVISESVFQSFAQRGATSREDLIIIKDLRDANALDCRGTFSLNDPLEKWFTLN